MVHTSFFHIIHRLSFSAVLGESTYVLYTTHPFPAECPTPTSLFLIPHFLIIHFLPNGMSSTSEHANRCLLHSSFPFGHINCPFQRTQPAILTHYTHEPSARSVFGSMTSPSWTNMIFSRFTYALQTTHGPRPRLFV